MAEKRTIDINIKNNADEATKDFNTFNDALDETAKSAKNVNSTFEEVYGELQPLTTRLGEAEDRLYELALAGDTTSKEYQELLTKVGEYRKVQIETDLAVDGAATTMTQKLGSALNGVTSGFATTQGALALFGTENEALEKSLLKVQGALAIQQGVDGLRTSYKELGGATGLATKAQAALNFVMSLNPFVLIATAIAAAIAALASFTSVLDPVIEGLKQLSDFIGLTDFAEEEAHQETMRRIEEENQARKRAFDARQKQFDREIALLEAEGKSSFALRQQKIEDSIAIQKQEAKAYETAIKLYEANAKRLGQATGILDEYKQKLTEINESIKDQENQLAINVINNNKKKADSYKAYVDKKEAQRLKDEQRERERLNNIANLENEFQDRIAQIEEENYQRTLTDEERELRAVQDKYFELETLAEGNAEALNEIEIARLNEENEIKAKYATEAYNAQKALDDKAAAEEKERRDKQLEDIKKHQEREQAIRMATVDTAIQGFQLIADFAESFAGDDVKRQKKAFQIKKAADIASATVDGYRAVLSTYAQTPGGPVLKGIAAGIAGGFAALQIANIARQQFEGEGGGGDFSADTGGGAGEVITPEFNVVGDAGINQLAQLQQQPTQAYVVSGEVTSAQALDRNRVTNATL